ncbi:MAG: signal transduction histidine kinase, partial [Arthrobacter sp.]|nr:signal transduction histidine kinase [Arthrobacter sp.]
MTRFEQKSTPALFTAIVLSLAAVYVADLFTRLGIAVWVLYFIPIVLSLFVWRPIVPFLVAGLASLLIVLAFMTDAPGMDPNLARINRGLAILTIWAMALVGYLFIRNRLAVRKQEWLQTGQTLLSERMGGDLRLEQLGESTLRILSEYLDAHVGAIYFEDEGSFRRFATYAVPAGGVPERFTAGEGLLGQAVKDERIFLVRDVPEGYLSVGSALGKGRPRHLLVAPVSVDDSVNAVLELGFLHPVYEADPELLERVGQSIAVAVRSAKYRMRLEELLEETQRQAEELQVQSEELRVSNEELEEQGRALRESQVRLELQQTELEQTNSQLEEQTQLLEAQRDDLGRTQSALQAQARELEQASRYKTDFLANMSHELRTPLNSSLILAKLLADNPGGNLSGEQVKYAETIQSAGNDLLTLINDILDLSKIEAGRMDVRVERIRVSQLLESLGRTFRPVAAQKGLEYRTQVGAGAPELLETDPQRLEQILKNLLSNALKFTEQGGVTLEVRAGPPGRVAFLVWDTGIGIPPEQQGMI